MRAFQFSVTVAVAAFALAAAQTTNVPSVNLFINDDLDGDAGYAASIVTACADQTVYEMRCTSGPAFVEPYTCGANAPIITLTEGPSVYVVYYSTQVIAYGETATGTVSESCKLQGTTAADCSANVFLKAGGTSTKASTTSLLTGADYHRFNVAITGGADKTASATGSCKSSGATSQTNSRGVVTIAVLGALGLAAVLSL